MDQRRGRKRRRKYIRGEVTDFYYDTVTKIDNVELSAVSYVCGYIYKKMKISPVAVPFVKRMCCLRIFTVFNLGLPCSETAMTKIQNCFMFRETCPFF